MCSLRIAESSPSYPPPPLLSPLNSLLSSFNMLSVNVSWRLRACTHRSARRPCLSLAACGSVRVPHRRGCEFVLQQVRPTWGRDTVASPFGGSRVPPAAYFNRQRRFLFILGKPRWGSRVQMRIFFFLKPHCHHVRGELPSRGVSIRDDL